VVIGARRFHSNESAVAFLLDSISAIPGGRLVDKTHPRDSERKEDVLRGLVGERGTVVSDVHPHTLIEAADCVAVRNSTLGFEALCYEKPVMALEHAKYNHPALTLGAASVAEAAASLSRVAERECGLPARDTLQRFIVHLLDRYLVPGRYDYHFERTQLELLSHFDRNRSHQDLETLLNHTAAPTLAPLDDEIERAIGRLRTGRVRPPSFWSRQARRIRNRLS
jgi:hypothetical protein